MGYRIQYGQTMKKIVVPEHNCNRKQTVAFPIFIVSAVLVTVLLLGKVEAVRNFLIPGNADVTEAALAALVNDLRGGEPIGDAITAFCTEIIDNANVPR